MFKRVCSFCRTQNWARLAIISCSFPAERKDVRDINKNTVSALSNLGFPPDYLEAADRVLDECKINAEKKLRRKNSRLDKCGIPEEKLLEMQQKLIEEVSLISSLIEKLRRKFISLLLFQRLYLRDSRYTNLSATFRHQFRLKS